MCQSIAVPIWMRYKVLGFSGIGNWELGIGKKVSCTSRVRELLYTVSHLEGEWGIGYGALVRKMSTGLTQISL
jgi:hypothetical protein